MVDQVDINTRGLTTYLRRPLIDLEPDRRAGVTGSEYVELF
ncbi:hypothetical protein GGR46_001542 [Sphingomonas kyeonggiensis]|uniref:Uncharacterized protein n=1 Tax=Sphingomonas kyeonggiensis TaxID=1268553 RepID=A0A7W6JR37_9SPHN|nr:hypothetical protein [Sphingomonas kyeonggiensis]